MLRIWEGCWRFGSAGFRFRKFRVSGFRVQALGLSA